MSCRLFLSVSSDALDGASTREEALALENHLFLCRDCAERQAEMEAQRELLALAGEAPCDPPPGLERELFARIEADRRGIFGRLLRAALPFLPRRPLVPSAAAAAFLLVALATVVPIGPAQVSTASTSTVAISRLLGAVPAPAAGMLTVWDSSAETIVASIDPDGLAGSDAVHTRGRSPLPRPFELPRPAEVRIFLFHRIIVDGR